MDIKKHITSYKQRVCRLNGNNPKYWRYDRAGNKILMMLTFDEWLAIWVRSGKIELRGCGSGKFCMARHNDLGHYEVGNVSIIGHTENAVQGHIGRKRSQETRNRLSRSLQVAMKEVSKRPEVRKARSIMNSKPCTIDGVKVYPSRKALVAELGSGRHGANHSDFRYLSDQR